MKKQTVYNLCSILIAIGFLILFFTYLFSPRSIATHSSNYQGTISPGDFMLIEQFPELYDPSKVDVSVSADYKDNLLSPLDIYIKTYTFDQGPSYFEGITSKYDSSIHLNGGSIRVFMQNNQSVGASVYCTITWYEKPMSNLLYIFPVLIGGILIIIGVFLIIKQKRKIN
jgi:hypothetical protein